MERGFGGAKRALLGETVRRLAIPFVSGCAALKEEEGQVAGMWCRNRLIELWIRGEGWKAYHQRDRACRIIEGAVRIARSREVVVVARKLTACGREVREAIQARRQRLTKR
jgi:hypothetical protein